MPRPLVATIDIAAMQSNLAVAKACAPGSKICAVVKANAYGHGLHHGFQGFAAADALALVEIDSAVALREMGWTKKILLLEGFFEMSELKEISENAFDISVHCIEQVEMLEAARLNSPIDIHLKMNTGMNRLGFKPENFRAVYQRLQEIRAVRDIIFMTHFANAEQAENSPLPPAVQLQRFTDATRGLHGETSLSNSAADLLLPNLPTDWIRPGIMLYGATPGAKTAQQFGLQPAMTLTSKIIGIQHVEPGDAVGYGSVFVADQPMTIGVVACGYADGYPRHAPTGTPIMVDAMRTRVVGRVSMDMMTVDLTLLPDSGVGSNVTLWGGGLPIDEVAQAAGTIGYELMCAIAPRVRLVAA